MTDIQDADRGVPPRVFQPKLQPGAAAATTWRVFRRHPWRFLGLALIPFVPGILAAIAGFVGGKSGGSAAKGIEAVLDALQYAIQFISQAAIIVAATRVVSGQTFGVGQVFGVAMRRVFPLFGVILLSVIVFFIGFLLLVIPGLILGVYMMLGVPVCVLERMGPIAALNRSYALTKGNWWRIVGAVCLALLLPLFALAALIVAFVLALGVSKLLAGVLTLLVGIPAVLVLTAVGSIFYAVLFVELRTLKEGPPREAIADVFS